MTQWNVTRCILQLAAYLHKSSKLTPQGKNNWSSICSSNRDACLLARMHFFRMRPHVGTQFGCIFLHKTCIKVIENCCPKSWKLFCFIWCQVTQWNVTRFILHLAAFFPEIKQTYPNTQLIFHMVIQPKFLPHPQDGSHPGHEEPHRGPANEMFTVMFCHSLSRHWSWTKANPAKNAINVIFVPIFRSMSYYVKPCHETGFKLVFNDLVRFACLSILKSLLGILRILLGILGMKGRKSSNHWQWVKTIAQLVFSTLTNMQRTDLPISRAWIPTLSSQCPSALTKNFMLLQLAILAFLFSNPYYTSTAADINTNQRNDKRCI